MAKPKRVTYFTTMLEDKPGTGLAFARSLKAKKIGIAAVWAYATQTGQAEVYCIPKDIEKFRVFLKSTGTTTREGSGFLLKGKDKTGALIATLEVLAKAGINVTAVHGISAGGKCGCFLRVADSDIEKAAVVLGTK
jgi:hypothetical protein